MADNVATAASASQNSENEASDKGIHGVPVEATKISIKEAPRQIVEYVRGMKRKNQILAGALITIILLASIIIGVLLNRVHYTALYSGLSPDEAGEIMSVLKEEGVNAKMDGTSTILVPEQTADNLRVDMAAKGYPKTGLNYDLFTNGSDFGATDLETRTRLQYTLQENLRTTIKNMGKIKDCIVIVNLATNSSYVVSNNTTPASAAVMLQLEDGEELSTKEAESIAQFVMKSVPKLTLENISIVDSQMNSYDINGENNGSESTYSATQMQMAEQMKKILTEQAMSILRPAVGSGNVAVSVNLALDFDKVTQNSVEFAPPIEGETEGMIRSLQESQDASDSGNGAGGPAGTNSNGVSATGYAARNNASGNSANSSARTYNYELNELRTQIEKAQGKIADLSVSVLINSEIDGADKVAEQAKGLVANAIGVDPKYITISSLPFVETAGEKGFEDYLTASQEDIKRAQWFGIMKVGLLCITLLICLLIVLRFFRKKKEGDLTDQEWIVGEDGEVQLPNELQEERLLTDLVQEKSSETEKVEKLIEEYPDAAVQILRNWLTED